MDTQYQPEKIEKEVQQCWETQKCFEAEDNTNQKKFFCLSMMPYPSGYLHMGHVRNYTIGDVIARYQRMLGKNVMQPMSWDAFGLPAENAAIQHKIPPAEWTYKNIDYMRQQFKRLGFGFDWKREFATCDPTYYRWEQWFFLKLYEKGLVYQKNAEVNWDPVDQTVLANEQVVNGRGWRSGAVVERKEIPQWFFKITAYAEALLADLDQLSGWPEQVKTMQRNWIGQSKGIEMIFPVENQPALSIFTTRPDTVFGVTYLAIAALHPLAKSAAHHNSALQSFLDECKNIKVSEAELATLPKKGMFTGLYATHPLTEERIPIWVANFVLMDYGTGALMAVPAHDQRDHELAKKYQLSIKPVIKPLSGTWDFSLRAYTDPGIVFDSGAFSGMPSEEAQMKIMTTLEKAGKGKSQTHYRLRDWGVSRQRYWGAPIPIIHCKECGAVPVPDQDLPVLLPTQIQFSGLTSPLQTMPEFYEVDCPRCHQAAKRECDTFDTFFESSWYYARFACPDQQQKMLDERANTWVPVDQYVGGIEHAVLHLLYARFIHKALRDEGLLKSDEPFTRLLTQGMVLNQGIKMSKSKGNTVDPQPLIDRYGADTVRLFIMFAAPPEQNLEWSDSGVEGAHRFLKKLWAWVNEYHDALVNTQSDIQWNALDPSLADLMRQFYEVMSQIQFDYDRLQFNTVVSGCMKLFNLIQSIAEHAESQALLRFTLSILLPLLAPITPHITEVLWQALQYDGLLVNATWPTVDPSSLKTTQLQMIIQINGKLRSKIVVPINADQQQIESLSLNDAKVQQTIQGKTVKKIIIVPKKLINIVTD